MIHPRISLHQVALVSEPSTAFVEHCRAIGVGGMTLVTPVLFQPGELDAALAALADGGPKVVCVNHMFALNPNLPEDSGGAAAGLMRAIDVASVLGAPSIYLISGGEGRSTGRVPPRALPNRSRRASPMPRRRECACW